MKKFGHIIKKRPNKLETEFFQIFSIFLENFIHKIEMSLFSCVTHSIKGYKTILVENVERENVERGKCRKKSGKENIEKENVEKENVETKNG